MIDSITIRANACAAGNGDQTEQILERSNADCTSRIHLMVNSVVNPLKTIIAPGNSHDSTPAGALLKVTWY